jgi:hypothetical protein
MRGDEFISISSIHDFGVDLLDDLQGIGNAAGPEGVPDLIDLIFDGAGNHVDILSGQKSLSASITKIVFTAWAQTV